MIGIQRRNTIHHDLKYDGKPLYFRRLNAGTLQSNYFQIKNRWSVDGSVSLAKRTWENEKFMTTLMGSRYSLKMKITKNILRTMIGLRKYICSQFKPNVYKIIYDMFETILDFSMGWGDRLDSTQ